LCQVAGNTDPIWHLSSCSGEANFCKLLHSIYLLNVYMNVAAIGLLIYLVSLNHGALSLASSTMMSASTLLMSSMCDLSRLHVHTVFLHDLPISEYSLSFSIHRY